MPATRNNVPWILVVVTFITVAAVGQWHWFKFRRKDDEDDSDDEFNWGDNDDPDSVPAFPWEPKKTAATKPKYMFRDRFDSEHERKMTRKKHPINTDDASKQLDFLASMTFANGGIRAPNCPCCY
jgi:hypothetical protein